MAYYYKTGVIVPFIQKFYKQMIVVVAGLFIASMATMTFNASAATTVVYDAIPEPLPSSLPSIGFQARSTSELGSKISFGGTERNLSSATVTMVSWACESGQWNLGDCVTTPGTFFEHPITLNLYNVDVDGEPGTVIHSVTQDFEIPYRPTSDPDCTDGRWLNSDDVCTYGFAHNVEFDLTGVTVPDQIIYGIAYNTGTYGEEPIGSTGPYDALNVGLNTDVAAPYVGSETNPELLFVNAINGYGNGTFSSQGGWSAYTIAARVAAEEPDTTPPADLVAIFNERPGGEVVANGGVTDSLMFTFNLSATGDPVRYQLQYWNDIPGSQYKELTPWNPTDLTGYSSSLGVYNDQFTQGEGVHYFAFSACDAADNCSEYSAPFVVTYDNPATIETKDDCKNGGWALSLTPSFKNQGQCVSHVASGGTSTDARTKNR